MMRRLIFTLFLVYSPTSAGQAVLGAPGSNVSGGVAPIDLDLVNKKITLSLSEEDEVKAQGENSVLRTDPNSWGFAASTLVKNAQKEAKSRWESLRAKVSGYYEKVFSPSAEPRGAAPTVQAGGEYTQTKDDLKTSIRDAKSEVKKFRGIEVATPGQVGDLPRNSLGVPSFSMLEEKVTKSKDGVEKRQMVKRDRIPRLNVGVEPEISGGKLSLKEIHVKEFTYQKPKELSSPRLTSDMQIENLKKMTAQHSYATMARMPENKDLGLGLVVTQKTVDKLQMSIVDVQDHEIKDLHKVTDDDLKMLTAVILYQKKGRCHVIAGVLDRLSHSAQHKMEADFYLGLCAHEMGFHHEKVKRLLPIVKSEDPDYAAEALGVLVEGLPKSEEVEVATALLNLKNKSLLQGKAADLINYVLAKGMYRKKDYATSAAHAQKVTAKGEKYYEARFLLGLSQYGLGKASESVKSLLDLEDQLVKARKEGHYLYSLAALNLGRMHFQKGEYPQAFQQFMKIKKDQPVWVEGLIAQGWSQIMLGDYAGAIGNMYSLHSPYFKSVFMPESFAVRTIGYLNICQYGDAYRTLHHLENSHGDWMKRIQGYQTRTTLDSAHYQSLRKYLAGKSQQDVDGLPFQVLREMGRRRNFLNVQDQINLQEDELAQFDFIHRLILEDKAKIKWRLQKARERLAQVKVKLDQSKKDPAMAKMLNELEAQYRNERDYIISYQYLTELIEESRQQYMDFSKRNRADIAQEKEGLKVKAARELKTNLEGIRKEIARVIENNEFLRYEIFSGAGENIRYQAAGGEVTTSNRIPASVMPKKILNWQFDGEYWEDEIGSYRSSLVNNCPKNQATLGGF